MTTLAKCTSRGEYDIKKGFSLIELVVVIVGVGILASLAWAGLSNLQTKARNTNRLANIEKIRSALQAYKNDNGFYPPASTVFFGRPLLGNNGKIYLEKIPENILDEDCPDQFFYTVKNNGFDYNLSYCLSTKMNNLAVGNYVASSIDKSCWIDCEGKALGASDGCGGVCTSVGDSDGGGGGGGTCDRKCGGAIECGDDGCSGLCDENSKACTVVFGETCSVSGTKTCQGSIYSLCNASDPRPVNCLNKDCGTDGCGGFCKNNCKANETCDANGQCVCAPNCDGKKCGLDGCGGSCPNLCNANESCDDNGQCVCSPECTGKECGDDGCNGTCGAGCGTDSCENFQCVANCSNNDDTLANMQRDCPADPSIGCRCGGGTVVCADAIKNDEICSTYPNQINIIAAPSCTTGGVCSESGNDALAFKKYDTDITTLENATSLTDGRYNFWDNAYGPPEKNNNPTKFSAAGFCLNLNVNGYADWYLPAQKELCLLWRSARDTKTACDPGTGTSGSGYLYGSSKLAYTAQANYWTSTEVSASNAYTVNYTGLVTSTISKTNSSIKFRCIRRF